MRDWLFGGVVIFVLLLSLFVSFRDGVEPLWYDAVVVLEYVAHNDPSYFFSLDARQW